MLICTDTDYDLGLALATENSSLLVKAFVENEKLKEAVFSTYLDKINAECSTLCQSSENSPSIFRAINAQSLPQLDWSSYIADLKEKAPVLFSILSKICTHNDHCNAFKRGPVHNPGICMAAAVLLNERNMHMTGIQSIMSLLLFSAHVEKQVCILQKLINFMHVL